MQPKRKFSCKEIEGINIGRTPDKCKREIGKEKFISGTIKNTRTISKAIIIKSKKVSILGVCKLDNSMWNLRREYIYNR